MNAPCNCSPAMNLGFRTVILDRRIEIKRVPILECELCDLYELHPEIRSSLRELMDQLKDEPGMFSVMFNEYNELAEMMYESYQEYRDMELEIGRFTDMVTQRRRERINLLLDVYGYAKSSNDEAWMDHLNARLAQLTYSPANAT